MTEKSLLKKSTGDEAGQSNVKGLNNVLNVAKTTKILNIPLWVWSVEAVVLLITVWLLATNYPQSTEPVEHIID